MPVSLTKGGNVSLTKEAPGLKAIIAGLGWDARSTDGKPFDLDASAFIVGADEKVLSDKHFVFFGEKASPDGAVVYGGDNLTGAGDGDDETVAIDLTKIAPEVKKIVIAVTIYEAAERGQNFGMVSNAFMRVLNQDGNAEIARFDLSEDASTETAMVFGEIYLNGTDWKFKAIGQGYAGGLKALATKYGVSV